MWANFIFASSAAFFASFGLKKTWGTEKQSHDFDVQGTVIAIPNKIKDIKNLKTMLQHTVCIRTFGATACSHGQVWESLK